VSDIEWNTDVSDELFDLQPPKRWQLQRLHRQETRLVTTLAPHVTLRIGGEGRTPMVTEADVVTVLGAESVEDPAEPIPPTLSVKLELAPQAAQRLRSFVAQHPRELLVADFNGETRCRARRSTPCAFRRCWSRSL
jgi:hypothetical protein